MAQEFIRHPCKSWWNNENPRVCTGAPHRPKFLIWARAVLISKFEKGFLERAGIVKGVLASLYQVENCWPLLEALISFLELRRTYHRHLSRGDGLSVVGPSGCYGDSHLCYGNPTQRGLSIYSYWESPPNHRSSYILYSTGHALLTFWFSLSRHFSPSSDPKEMRPGSTTEGGAAWAAKARRWL